MLIEQLEIETPRGTFAARAAGNKQAPLVLCLHGFPDNSATYDSLLERLAAAGMRAVAPYCRGYAPSPLRAPDGATFGNDLFAVLADDAVAIADALAPDSVASIVGHDNGAFTVYHALNRSPGRFARAVTLTAGHPAAVFRNTGRSPRQLWRSRYAIFFQLAGFAEARVQRDNYAYIEQLWRHWAAPGWTPPAAHLADVKRTFAASMPFPILHYRSGAFGAGNGWQRIAVPTLYLGGAEDGCVLPSIGAGQERYFTGAFQSELIPHAGHFLHLEQPDVVNAKIVDWVRA